MTFIWLFRAQSSGGDFFTSPTGDAKGTITAWSSEPNKDRFVYKAAAIPFYSVTLKHQV